jgi:hypothetical protein
MSATQGVFPVDDFDWENQSLDQRNSTTERRWHMSNNAHFQRSQLGLQGPHVN